MAAGRAIQQLLKRKFQSQYTAPPALLSLVSKQDQDGSCSAGMKSLRVFALLGAGVSGLLSFATVASADEAEHGLAAPNYPWPHNGILSSYDHASIRRGHQVYQQVCASCHSMSLLSYRDLVGVAYTEEETKAMAAEIEVVDGPNDEGEMFTRPGKLSDRFPQPYSNEQAARFANGGAYPPDLSLVTKARHNGQNYVFSLLTGYRDPPAGVTVREGLHYNPYFPGGAIAMPKMLIDGAIEYEDGTPPTASQMGKDVVTFLSWAAEPEMEERKLMGFKWIFLLSLALIQAGYYRRLKWSVVKSRKLRSYAIERSNASSVSLVFHKELEEVDVYCVLYSYLVAVMLFAPHVNALGFGLSDAGNLVVGYAPSALDFRCWLGFIPCSKLNFIFAGYQLINGMVSLYDRSPVHVDLIKE
ncbi:hypothetical protein NE237_020848 [Protea cynaroides]|uniref:Cytochrome c domain-containing protein n=1 Tax=Protea cynaroides TaxID=273540 RepID=A0A9Q0HA00_9MAGN|nr:hypothetical protein NE237_020848 [Protea cynaroides]